MLNLRKKVKVNTYRICIVHFSNFIPDIVNVVEFSFFLFEKHTVHKADEF